MRSRKLLTVDQVAAELNVSTRYVRDMGYERRIEVVRIGRLVRIPASSVERVISDGLTPASSSSSRSTGDLR